MDQKENGYYGYEKIEKLSKLCKFTNCQHISEPHCAVKKAIADGTLSQESFNNFYRDKKEKEHISNQKNKTKAVDYMKQRKLFQNPFSIENS
ncbi:hypothetical protein [Falsibacillus albus]|uniref:GTPase RsgA n=1 Tax=Falsibacillus albus TaxID=2478915 RepID=A0A3L7JPU1_9BACI|nr:hypothetical protein [Falsibacillus albus]RLQ92265.1 hypothetical protein D9X91_19505 [Falsibacillus albus]